MTRLVTLRNTLLLAAFAVSGVAGWLRGGHASGALTTLMFAFALLLAIGAYMAKASEPR